MREPAGAVLVLATACRPTWAITLEEGRESMEQQDRCHASLVDGLRPQREDERNELVVVYQPILAMADGAPYSAEALVRRALPDGRYAGQRSSTGDFPASPFHRS